MTLTYINKEDLKDGAYYLGECKYAFVATWSASTNAFEYMNTSKIYSTTHFSDTEDAEGFLPLFEIQQANAEVAATGQLQVKK